MRRGPYRGGVPFHRFCIVLQDAPAVVVHDTEDVLGAGKPLLGKGAKLPQRSRVVTLLKCLHARLEVLSPCRRGKRQE